MIFLGQRFWQTKKQKALERAEKKRRRCGQLEAPF
jgi:hypothetical protein